jgi:histidinol-phosphate/aromatic aminotransferase/cobyric acid decarboxylase-like protein
LLLLPNPGQPVDTCYTVDELRSLAFKCMWNDCVFAIDEAYYGFGAPTALELINECENVVILRTFSKAFGAAGIRLGYAVGSPRAIHPLDAIRLSGEVAGPSMRAAARLLAYYPDEILAGINQVIEGRDWLKASLRKFGYKARGDWANHVLLDLGSANEMRRICAAMDARGVHVKGNYPPPLDRHLLITAGPLPLMERFLDVFDECRREQAA